MVIVQSFVGKKSFNDRNEELATIYKVDNPRSLWDILKYEPPFVVFVVKTSTTELGVNVTNAFKHLFSKKWLKGMLAKSNFFDSFEVVDVVATATVPYAKVSIGSVHLKINVYGQIF